MKTSVLKKNISQKLKESGLSIRELERRAGLAQSCINNIMLGRSKSPSIEIAQAIARELNCTVDELLDAGEITRPALKWNKVLFSLSSDYVSKYLNSQPVNHIKLSDALFCIEQIYSYCSLKNNGKFDNKFAEWCCEKSFL